jgi:hypothetical protein
MSPSPQCFATYSNDHLDSTKEYRNSDPLNVLMLNFQKVKVILTFEPSQWKVPSTPSIWVKLSWTIVLLSDQWAGKISSKPWSAPWNPSHTIDEPPSSYHHRKCETKLLVSRSLVFSMVMVDTWGHHMQVSFFISLAIEKVSSHNLDVGFETHCQLQRTDKIRYILVKYLGLINVLSFTNRMWMLANLTC